MFKTKVKQTRDTAIVHADCIYAPPWILTADSCVLHGQVTATVKWCARWCACLPAWPANAGLASSLNRCTWSRQGMRRLRSRSTISACEYRDRIGHVQDRYRTDIIGISDSTTFYIGTFDKFPFPTKPPFLAVINMIIITLESLKKYRFSGLNPLCTRV